MPAPPTSEGMSLRQRLLLLTLLTSGIALLLGCTAYLVFDLHDAKARTLEELQSTADLIGTNVTAALTFDDAVAGEKLLEALRTRPHIRGAALYQPDGRFFAAYLRRDLNRKYLFPPSSKDMAEWSPDKLSVVRSIISDGKLVGRIRIESDLEDLRQRMGLYLQVNASIAASLLLTVYLLTGLLGHSITAPIRLLAETVRNIAEQKTYSQRAPLLSGKEMRQLGADFNHMLEEISKRDAELVEARDTLEQRVAERTRDLQVQISERERAEVALREREEMFRTLCEVAPVGIVLLDLHGTVTYTNRAWLEMTALTQEECIQGHWRSVIHPDDLERVQRQRESAIAGGQDYAMSYRLQNDARGLVWVDTIAQRIKGKHGEHAGYVAVIQDVTQHQMVAENLRRSKEAAEAANKAKSDFLANMSHEIRTPMNGIIGMTELTLDTDLTTEQRSYLGMVKSSADALLGIINDILDFSKIEAGKMALEHAVFSLPACIEEAVQPLALRASQKGLELSWAVDSGIPEYVKGDVTRLRQVMINLIGNGIKFTKEGSVSVRAALVRVEQGRIRLQITVADTGIGIPPEKHRQIFEAFSQADTSITRQFGGTGLGLSISGRLVQLMGGEIWLESSPGLGTKFFFTVLLSSVSPDEVPSQPAHLALQGVRALVVDDNEVNRRLLEHLLPAWGMEVSVASSGEEALELFTKNQCGPAPFSIVLMDKNMPRLDGLQTTDLLRKLPGGLTVPVLLLTSSPTAEDRPEQERVRIFKSISKPILRSELSEALQLALQGRKLAAHPGAPVDAFPVGASLRILLAEDNAVNQKLAVRLLEKMGHQVTLACNGREAVERAAQASFDLILMDIQMPEMGGMEATELIREHQERAGQRIPIVAMTAHAMKGDREKCLSGGMDGYVSKPIRLDSLKDEIAHVMAVADTGQTRRLIRT